MNPLVIIAVVLYVVIGIMAAVRSFGYLRQLNPAVASLPIVVGLCGLMEVVFWPMSQPITYAVLKRVAPQLLPVRKTRKVKALDRIADTLETVATRMLDDLEYARERIAGLEQSNRDIRENYDAVREERDEANRDYDLASKEVDRLSLEILRLTTPPTPAPVAAPVAPTPAPPVAPPVEM